MTAQPMPPLVTAKTHRPPRRAELLRRPRLLDQIYAHIEQQLFVITAPAGYGKTSVLVDFAHEADFPVAWYALDEFDNAPHTFLQYLIAAMRVHFPAFGAQALAALERAPGTLDSLQPVIALLANELFALPDHLTIILDDYHVIHDERIDQLLALLLKYTGENAHLFIGSRSLPRIPDQILLIARGQMSGFSINELKFTPSEIQALVQQDFDLTVSESRACELSQISDGWITALLLLGLQAGWRELIQGAVSTPDVAGRVYDYLAEQVFAVQPLERQRFLLGSSVLDPLQPEVLDALPGLSNSRAVLQELEQQQLFTTRLGGDAEPYAYHPLFRDFLKSRLRREHPQWFEQLLTESARQYAAVEQWERVVECYLTLGRTAEAAHALELAEDSLRSIPQVANLVPWMEALPQALRDVRPHLVSLKAKQYFFRGDLEQSVAQFERAVQMFLSESDPIAAADKLIFKANALLGLGRYEQVVAESLSVERMLAGHAELVTLCAANLLNRGHAEFALGRMASAHDTLRQAEQVVEHTDNWLIQANCALMLGVLERARGRLSEALEYYAAALRAWERLDNPNAAAITLNNIGNIYYLKGEYREAEKILNDALQRARSTRQLRAEATTLATLGDVRQDLGDYPAALELYGDALRAAAEAHYHDILLYGRLATASTYRSLGDFGRAQEWLRSAHEIVKASGSSAERMQVALQAGLLSLEQGQWVEAITELQQTADYFRQANNALLEATAEFHLAHALYVMGRAAESGPHLERTAELVELLGFDQFLVVAGKRAALTLAMASRLERVGPRFRSVLARMQPLSVTALPASTQSVAPAPKLSVVTLGQEKFVLAGGEVTQVRPLVRALFWLLLMRYPHGARKEELWEAMWPDVSEARADGGLRITVTRIRKALCGVTFNNGWYLLDAEHVRYDVREFDRWLADAAHAQAAGARIASLQQAIDLYAGDYLASVDAEWVVLERERLRKAYHAALIALGQAHVEAGDFTSALHAYDKASSVEPYLESSWQGSIETYWRMGNRAAAVAQYQKLETLLHSDLGVEPSPDVQRLVQRISMSG